MTGIRLSRSLRSVPPPNDRRLAVRVTPDALRHVRAKHPWVFEESVTSISHEAKMGDMAVIFDADRKFVAMALYDPESPIQFKILHVGKPMKIADAWWIDTFRRALEIRRPFLADPDADVLAYRIINGENDGLAGFVVDRYADTLVIKLYSAIWIPHLSRLTRLLLDVTGCGSAVLRLARNLQVEKRSGDLHGLTDGDIIAGDLPDGPVQFSEGGLIFEADVRVGQKTGHFLDQRANRLRIGAMASNREVLDVFASTGGFSVHAAAGGARSVHAVDLSAPTLAAAERNMALNSGLEAVARCAFTTEIGDAFEVMVQLARADKDYDIVVVDPPSFAQRQANIDGAVRAYTRLTHLALRLVRPGGVLMQASCSSRVTEDLFFDTVLDTAEDAGRSLSEIARTGHDIDHPIGFPEGAYLKAGFWTVGKRR